MRKVLFVLIIVALAYGGYTFGKPYLSSHFLKQQMQGLADKADVKTDREIVNELVAFARERGLPLNSRDFKVTRYDGRTSISVSYNQVVEVTMLSRQYRFKLDVIS